MKSLKKKIKVILEKTNTGFSAYAADDDIPVGTTGKNIAELQDNLLEALNLFYNERGFVIVKKNIAIEIDFQQFFQFSNINQQILADSFPGSFLEKYNNKTITKKIQDHIKIKRIQQTWWRNVAKCLPDDAIVLD